jgi:hypothetical protein
MPQLRKMKVGFHRPAHLSTKVETASSMLDSLSPFRETARTLGRLGAVEQEGQLGVHRTGTRKKPVGPVPVVSG